MVKDYYFWGHKNSKMTSQLIGNSIFIGRDDQGQGLLCVAVNLNGHIRRGMIGGGQPVPENVSRCLPEQNTAHCRIDVGPNFRLTITNLKPQNQTFVNNQQILSSVVDTSARVALGPTRYPLNLSMVLNAATKLVAAPQPQRQPQQPQYAPQRPQQQAPYGPQYAYQQQYQQQYQQSQYQQQLQQPQQPQQPHQKPSFSIEHLQYVWEDYHHKNMELKIKQRRINLIRGLSPIFTLGSGSLAAISRLQEWPESITYITTALTVIGVIISVYGFVLGALDKSIEEGDRLTNNFLMRYQCPNPECHKSLPNQPFSILKKNYTKCPYCGCTYTT